jgi:hypothetical protein
MMKFKMALAAAALTLLSGTAQAQLNIVLDLGDPLSPTSVATATSPGRVEFSATIFNIGPSDIMITADSLAVPGGIGFDLPLTDLFLLPDTIVAGGSYRADYLFGLDIPAAQTSFGGTYAIDTDFDPDGDGIPEFFAADFRVNIQPSQVPEPGTMALLLSGLVGGSLVMIRRRK